MNKDRPPAGAAQHSRFSRLTKWLTRAAADNEQLLVMLQACSTPMRWP